MTESYVSRLSDHPEQLEELASLHFQEWGHCPNLTGGALRSVKPADGNGVCLPQHHRAAPKLKHPLLRMPLHGAIEHYGLDLIP